MIPKEQRLDYYKYEIGRGNLSKYCDQKIKDGWVIMQIIPLHDAFSFHILMNKY